MDLGKYCPALHNTQLVIPQWGAPARTSDVTREVREVTSLREYPPAPPVIFVTGAHPSWVFRPSKARRAVREKAHSLPHVSGREESCPCYTLCATSGS